MGYCVKEAREKIGLTQEELSKKANVSRAIIVGLESGEVKVTTTKTLVKIANALGVKVSDIFFN